MSFFSDLFGGGYSSAAQAEITGLNNAQAAATPYYNQAGTAITTNYGAALQPYTQLGQTASQGTTALGNALGLNGPAGSNSALTTLESTPGYQFQLQQGEQAVDRGAAARGQAVSGNLMTAEDNYAQGLAGTTYNNYVSQLQPYLGVAENAAGGTANVATGQGQQLAANDVNLGNLNYNTQAGIGNATAAADTATQNAENSFINGALGLGTKLLGYSQGKTATA